MERRQASHPHILVIDDEEGMRVSLKKLLEHQGFAVSTAASAKVGLEVLHQSQIDLILCDIVMPDMSGLLFLSKIGDDIPVVMMTAFASIETTRKAFKSGARDYLVKPFDIDELTVVIKQNVGAVASPHAPEGASGKFLQCAGKSYRQVLDLADKFSRTDMPVLITGESGTGKEVIADYIYERSLRCGRPFVKINCAAIPETLLESELFGYEKGAFTGAAARKLGKFDEANGGTIFLDEIGDMPLFLQAKMLRILQDLSFYRLGGRETVAVDTRIIAASNQNLDGLIEEHRFREDLYHRLNGVHLQLPPLRRRREDMPYLIGCFVDHYAEKYRKPIGGVAPEALRILEDYRWPGNIRELKNCIERSIVVCEDGELQVENLPDKIKSGVQDFRPDDGADEAPRREASGTNSVIPEMHDAAALRRSIIRALEKAGGNRIGAARELSMSRKTLYNKMKDLGITHDFK